MMKCRYNLLDDLKNTIKKLKCDNLNKDLLCDIINLDEGYK